MKILTTLLLILLIFALLNTGTSAQTVSRYQIDSGANLGRRLPVSQFRGASGDCLHRRYVQPGGTRHTIAAGQRMLLHLFTLRPEKPVIPVDEFD